MFLIQALCQIKSESCCEFRRQLVKLDLRFLIVTPWVFELNTKVLHLIVVGI